MSIEFTWSHSRWSKWRLISSTQSWCLPNESMFSSICWTPFLLPSYVFPFPFSYHLEAVALFGTRLEFGNVEQSAKLKNDIRLPTNSSRILPVLFLEHSSALMAQDLFKIVSQSENRRHLSSEPQSEQRPRGPLVGWERILYREKRGKAWKGNFYRAFPVFALNERDTFV